MGYMLEDKWSLFFNKNRLTHVGVGKGEVLSQTLLKLEQVKEKQRKSIRLYPLGEVFSYGSFNLMLYEYKNKVRYNEGCLHFLPSFLDMKSSIEKGLLVDDVGFLYSNFYVENIVNKRKNFITSINNSKNIYFYSEYLYLLYSSVLEKKGYIVKYSVGEAHNFKHPLYKKKKSPYLFLSYLKALFKEEFAREAVNRFNSGLVMRLEKRIRKLMYAFNDDSMIELDPVIVGRMLKYLYIYYWLVCICLKKNNVAYSLNLNKDFWTLVSNEKKKMFFPKKKKKRFYGKRIK